jgi:signal peptidase I
VLSSQLDEHLRRRLAGQVVEVPAGKYLVLGDNRDNSRDSRYFGLVDRELIEGRAVAVVFSLDYDNYYLPRFSRLFRSLY